MSCFQYPIVGSAEKLYATRLLFDWGEGTECIYVYSRLRFDALYPIVCNIIRDRLGSCKPFFQEEMDLSLSDVLRHVQRGNHLYSWDELVVYLMLSIEDYLHKKH